ncbi:MAG TPA: glycosyltransferase family 9 protein [Opitutaceae bacterium]|nr:glycosyltransferase family 9 protein [Opitutaceae bacterium]
MLKLLLKILGWLVAHAPEPWLHGLAVVLGDGIFFASLRRRRLVLSNLHHAFPEKPAGWHRRIGRESCRRLVETGLLSLATPFLGEDRLRAMVRVSPALQDLLARQRAAPEPAVLCTPHLAYWEIETALTLVAPGAPLEFGIIYRPLDHAGADDWIKRSRERFGMRLLSRKEGFAEALKILRRKGFVGVLFDQNAGMQGALTLLFGRVCSSTELPGLMAEKFSARVIGIFSRRRGFWRLEMDADPVATDGTSAGTTLGLNRWLESLLRSDENLCASWLWAHDRWRHQDVPARRLRLESKRSLLDMPGFGPLPRRTRIWIRLPNWLGDVVMVLPLLRALRRSRPDAEITLLAQGAFLPLLDSWGVADRLRALPRRGAGYFGDFRRAEGEYPDVFLLFTHSFRGDLEAWLTRCPQRFGVVRHGRRRPLLSHRYVVPTGFVESHHHQIELWENFLRHFGLAGNIDRTPLAAPGPRPAGAAPIGLIAGSENNPEKRWPVAHWRALVEALPDRRFILFGTANDRPITAAVALGFSEPRVTDLAGRTDLPAFAGRLQECGLLVTNDTGGMHLANALGIPLVALFGPTNPVRTGPVFSAPAVILQPPGCDPTSGASLRNLAPERVAAAVRSLAA